MVASTGYAAAFAPMTMAADARRLQQVLAGFFAGVPSDVDWNHPTERQGTGWTLYQTLAHVTAVAEAFQWVIDETLAGRHATMTGFTSRTDLPTYNERQIIARQHIAPKKLMQTLLDIFDRLAHRCVLLTPGELLLRVDIPVYNSPMSIAEVIGTQLIHLNIVHAAQLANGAGLKPMWLSYTPELMQRQLTRLFYVMPYTYWTERGGNLRATINYIVDGPGGGRWSLKIGPTGATVREGTTRWARLNMWMSNPRVVCRILTFQTTMVQEMLSGQALAWGDLGLGSKLFSLFSPT